MNLPMLVITKSSDTSWHAVQAGSKENLLAIISSPTLSYIKLFIHIGKLIATSRSRNNRESVITSIGKIVLFVLLISL